MTDINKMSYLELEELIRLLRYLRDDNRFRGLLKQIGDLRSFATKISEQQRQEEYG